MTRRSPCTAPAIAARPAGPGFSPLAERLGLGPGSASPWLQQGMSWLGAEVPYARATALFHHFTGTTVSRSTVRRTTVATAAAHQQLDAARSETEATGATGATGATVGAPPLLPMQLSVDGSMLPILGEGWREVRVASLGVVSPDPSAPDAVRTTDLSYVAALCDAQTFQTVAVAEVMQRGLDQAVRVAAVSDGARWIQDFADYHCPHAVRILDFAHAAEYLAQAAQASFGPGTAATSEWFVTQRHELRHGDPDRVLAALRRLPESEARDTARRYLGERRPMLAYRAFVAAGYPIGSGCVESGHKTVLQARLKRGGMHWHPDVLPAMIALRVSLANGRWDEVWPRLGPQRRQAQHTASAARRQARRPPAPVPPLPPLPPPVVLPALPSVTPAPGRPKLVQQGRPTAQHPWRRPFIRRSPGSTTKM